MTADLEWIEELKRQWMAMIDAVEDPLAIINEKFEIQRQNASYHREAASHSSLSIRDYPGKTCYEVFAGRSSPCPKCLLTEALDQGQSRTWETTDLFANRLFEVRVQPGPEHKAAVVHYRDVTAQKRLQESLSQADKLAALGKLSGRVAHELNSPLAGILAFAQMVLKELDAEDPHKQDLEEIESAAQKCKVIVEGMLGFARQDAAPEMKEFDLKESLLSVLRLAKPSLKKHQIQVDLVLPEGPVPYVGCRGKIEQILLNLITNAMDAMKSGGDLCLSLLQQNPLILEVEDNGTGIPAEELPRIFDPFFTTKPFGQGTGLGLSISYSIAKLHGGEIQVESTWGEGSVFRLVLPKVQ